MYYTNVVLNSNNLLGFLARSYGGYIENHLDSQPLNVYITYSSYVNLIEELVNKKIDILRNSLEIYSLCLSKGKLSKHMLRLFYLDVALSGLIELKKSYKRGRATRVFSLVDVDSIQYIDVDYNNIYNFLNSNYNGNQYREVVNTLYEQFDIPIDILDISNKFCSDNSYMYYVSISYALYYMYAKYIINIKGG